MMLSHLKAAATNLINSESPKTSKFFLMSLSVLVLLTAGFLVSMRGAVVLVYPSDVPSTLDGAWRIMNGQIPHVDFYTPMGPVIFLVVALGMCLGGACVSSITYANALFLVVLSLWAWTIARTRMSPALSFVFSLYVGFMVAATSVYGHVFKDLGYSAIYNRYGAELAALALIESLGCSRQQFRRWSSLFQGVSTGIALALTCFLKLNFFGVVLMGLVAGAILLPQNRYRWVGLCAGSLAITFLMLAYLRFDVAAFYHDMVVTGRLRASGFARSAFGIVTYPEVFSWTFLMASLWCIAPCAEGYYRSWLSPRIALGGFVLFLILVQTILSLTNTQVPLATLFPAGSLLILEGARRALQQNQAADPGCQLHRSAGWMATLLLTSYFVASILVPDMESLPYSTFIRVVGARGVTASEPFNSRPMADMLAPRDPEYVRSVNDGCDLLRRYSGPSDRIVTLDLTNPFSFALQRPPPTGDAIGWSWMTFSASVHLSPDRVFKQAAIVMVPRKPIEERPERQPMAVYSTYLDAHYTLQAESTFWRLYRQRSN